MKEIFGHYVTVFVLYSNGGLKSHRYESSFATRNENGAESSAPFVFKEIESAA
jgi:hypothetical protein